MYYSITKRNLNDIISSELRTWAEEQLEAGEAVMRATRGTVETVVVQGRAGQYDSATDLETVWGTWDGEHDVIELEGGRVIGLGGDIKEW